jgi:hypothetical protein
MVFNYKRNWNKNTYKDYVYITEIKKIIPIITKRLILYIIIAINVKYLHIIRL